MNEPSCAPWPLLDMTIDSKTEVDRQRMSSALAELVAEDPSFRVSIDRISGQTLLLGMSEDHLDSKLGILKFRYDVDAELSAPRIAFRETIARAADIDYTHKKLSGGVGEFARVKLHVAPKQIGSDFTFESKIAGGDLPREYVSGVRNGCQSAARDGVVANFPIVSLEVQLVDGAFHRADSSVRAFEIAARAAFLEALQKGDTVMIEPIMAIEIVTPDEYGRTVISDLDARRGRIQRRHRLDETVVINATVPLANTFGYATTLRRNSKGRAAFTMRYSNYERVPTPGGQQPSPAAAMALRA